MKEKQRLKYESNVNQAVKAEKRNVIPSQQKNIYTSSLKEFKKRLNKETKNIKERKKLTTKPLKKRNIKKNMIITQIVMMVMAMISMRIFVEEEKMK